MATKIDRVSRSAIGLLDLIEQLRAHNCHLVLIDEGLDTSTSAGDLTSGLLGVIGGWERRRIAERTTAGRRAAAEHDGRFVGSPPRSEHHRPGCERARQTAGHRPGAGPDGPDHVPTRRPRRRHPDRGCAGAQPAGLPAPAGAPWTAVTLGRWMLPNHRSEPHQAPGDSTGSTCRSRPSSPPPKPPRGGPGKPTAANTHPNPRTLPAVRGAVRALRAARHGPHRRLATPHLLLPSPLLAPGHPGRQQGCRNVPCDTSTTRSKPTSPGAHRTGHPHRSRTPTSPPHKPGGMDALAGLLDRLARVDADLAARRGCSAPRGTPAQPWPRPGPPARTPQDPATRHRPRPPNHPNPRPHHPRGPGVDHRPGGRPAHRTAQTGGT